MSKTNALVLKINYFACVNIAKVCINSRPAGGLSAFAAHESARCHNQQASSLVDSRTKPVSVLIDKKDLYPLSTLPNAARRVLRAPRAGRLVRARACKAARQEPAEAILAAEQAAGRGCWVAVR